nr:hypothetical protein Iba_chr15aCG11070 [Ipomoea batatas]
MAGDQLPAGNDGSNSNFQLQRRGHLPAKHEAHLNLFNDGGSRRLRRMAGCEPSHVNFSAGDGSVTAISSPRNRRSSSGSFSLPCLVDAHFIASPVASSRSNNEARTGSSLRVISGGVLRAWRRSASAGTTAATATSSLQRRDTFRQRHEAPSNLFNDGGSRRL